MKKVLYFGLGALTMLVIMLGYKFVTGNMFCLDGETMLPEITTETADTTTAPPVVHEDGSKTINLSPAQEGMLETFGVDPNTVPTTISPEQEACFREVFGDARVEEILAGDSPSLLEMMKGKSCIE